MFSPLEFCNGSGVGGRACAVVVDCWAGGCPASNTNVTPEVSPFVVGGGQGGSGEPCGRVSTNSKVPLNVRLDFDSHASIRRHGGTGGGSAGGGGLCGIRSFILAGVVLLVVGAVLCHG